MSYSKFIDTTATNFTLAAYRYSTKGYYSFSDALYSREGYQRLRAQYYDYEDRFGVAPDMSLSTWDALRAAQPKNTFTLNLNQRLLNNWGTVFVSGTQRDYWNSQQTTREYQMGYSNAIGRASYTLSASRVRNRDSEEETRLYLSLSLPFSLFDNNAWITSSLTASDSHYEQSNISMSGNALASNRLSYTLSGSNARGGKNAASVNAAYRSNFATLGGSYSESSDYRQTGLSGRGSLVAYPWHVLASNETGTTMTIVDAPKAEGLMVNGDESIMTNRDGVALVPYATPYRKNAITLTETENSAGAEVIGNMANVAPYDGAVSYIRFETDKRQSWVLHATRADGKPLPFAPKYKGTVTMDWRLPLNLDGFNVDLNSSLVYQSKTNFDINQNPNAFQSAYAIWDGGIRVSTSDDKYSLSFIVKNITDKQFVTQRIPNGTSFMRQITPRDAERYFGVTGRVNF